jgi:aspartate kinase
MIVQNVSARDGRTDISFTLPKSDGRRRAGAGAQGRKAEIGFESALIKYDDQIGKVSLVGAGMKTHPGVSAKFFGALPTPASTSR